MRLIKAEDVCEMLDIIADSKAITTKKGAIGVAKTALDDIPAIDPESLRLLAVWKYFHKQNIAVCTNCSFERDLNVNFGKAISCPNCGAKMTKDGA